jgi:hypothetical protein
MPEPHAFAVRNGIGRLRAARSLMAEATLQPPFAPNAAAATASHPNVRDDRDTPLVERMRRREF